MLEALRFADMTLRLLLLRRLPSAQVLALQGKRLRRLLYHAYEHSPFYRRHLRGLDLDRCRLADVPPLTKPDMMDHFDELVTDRRVSRAGLERFLADPENVGHYYRGRYAVCHTSGSQGQPALVVQERPDVLRTFAVQAARGQPMGAVHTELLGRLWQRTRLAVVTQRPGFYPSGSLFAYLAAEGLPFLRLLRLSVFDPVADIVDRLNAFRPHVLLGYTSSLEVLAREEQAGRLRLRAGGLRLVTNTSEPLPPASRALIEGAFGVFVADQYSMAECLALSSGCLRYSGAHLNADLACLEVVDDDSRPVPDGLPGSKVLVTNLYNRIQPLIRYEISDVVTMSPSRCRCGSNLPLIQSISGRTKERCWVQVNGAYRELPYYIFLAGLHHCLELAEHQVLQTGLNRFVLRVAPQRGKTVSADRLRNLVEDSVRAEGMAGLFTLEVQIVDEIRPDPNSGKMQRVLNLIGPPPDVREPQHLAQLGADRVPVALE